MKFATATTSTALLAESSLTKFTSTSWQQPKGSNPTNNRRNRWQRKRNLFVRADEDDDVSQKIVPKKEQQDPLLLPLLPSLPLGEQQQQQQEQQEHSVLQNHPQPGTASLVECDPDDATGIAIPSPDVGLLACDAVTETCQRSPFSDLGGFCVPHWEGEEDKEEQEENVRHNHRRHLIAHYCDDPSCSCLDYDVGTGTGIIVCADTYIYESCNGVYFTSAYAYSFTNFVLDEYSTCTQFSGSIEQLNCVTVINLDSGTNQAPSCYIEHDGRRCQRCQVTANGVAMSSDCYFNGRYDVLCQCDVTKEKFPDQCLTPLLTPVSSPAGRSGASDFAVAIAWNSVVIASLTSMVVGALN